MSTESYHARLIKQRALSTAPRLLGRLEKIATHETDSIEARILATDALLEFIKWKTTKGDEIEAVFHECLEVS